MKTIAIVDDTISLVTVLRDKLSKTYRVITADDGKKGLALILKEHPDLVLLDINMPVMDGIDVLKALRGDPFGKKLPVIMLTNLEPTKDILKEMAVYEPSTYFVKTDVTLEAIKKKADALLG